MDDLFGDPKEKCKLSNEELAPFCDSVSYNMCMKINNNLDKAEELATSIGLSTIYEKDMNFNKWNTTSLGNIARFAVSCKSDKISNYCKELLNEYRFWAK